jgi:hypothetical protein
MGSAGGQLALMVLDEHDRKPSASPVATAHAPAKRQANLDELPPGALESALARAQARLALTEQEMAA